MWRVRPSSLPQCHFSRTLDYLKYPNHGAVNQDFQAVWQTLRGPVCQGRMHWGKTARAMGARFNSV